MQTIPPTCQKSGEAIYQCSRCDYSYSVDTDYATGHTYTSTIVKSASCTEAGLRRNTCEKCGDVSEIPIAPRGHSYRIADVHSEGGSTSRTYQCSTCGDGYVQELDDQYDQVANYIEYLFEQYSPYMYWVLLATAGLWSIAIGVAIAIAVKNEDKAKARKMLVNYLVGLVVIFVIIVACPYLVRGIASLVT